MNESEFDFSETHPGAAELKDAFARAIRSYVGGWRLSRQEVLDYQAAGLIVRWIFETTTTRAFEGYAAGFLDGRWAQDRVEEVDPGVTEMIVNLADTNNVAGHEAAISEYARGFGDGATRMLVLEGYGPLAALIAGSKGSKKLTRWWGVEVWYPGSVSTNAVGHVPANLAAWAKLGANVVQIFGESPVPGTDLNIVVDPFYYAAVIPAVKPIQEDEDPMFPFQVNDPPNTPEPQRVGGFYLLQGGRVLGISTYEDYQLVCRVAKVAEGEVVSVDTLKAWKAAGKVDAGPVPAPPVKASRDEVEAAVRAVLESSVTTLADLVEARLA